MKATVYETITNQIVEAIEAGALTFTMPWHRGRCITHPINARSQRLYRGVNIITLWATAEAKGYTSGEWATYQQWAELGAQVRKGEKATTVFFWKKANEAEEQDAEGSQEQRHRFMARAYHVFNAAQVDNYTPKQVAPILSEAERDTQAEGFFGRLGADIRHGGERCFYSVTEDHIQMVPFDRFKSGLSYYATLAHEVTHWTGAKHRLDRDLSGRFGSDSYAMEELVAELGAAFLSSRLGLEIEVRRDHAAYVDNWLKVLKADSRAIFTAAAKAQAAVDYILQKGGFETATWEEAA